MKSILVTIDFDGRVDRLLDMAKRMADALQCKVWLLHVASPNPDFVGYEAGPQYLRDMRAKELKGEHKQIQEYAKRLKDDQIEADGILIQGPTIQTILEESKKLHAELIIAGHHDKGFVLNALLGSVSREMVKKSKIPVLIVPLE